jgi:hypothetical protein
MNPKKKLEPFLSFVFLVALIIVGVALFYGMKEAEKISQNYHNRTTNLLNSY